ncbi:hypothetical protein BDQ94DRAFT_155518 [Aspergillus welwitschiae]|uniref:Uncharacterized protein n=1 Tax=Aspergillus welwitschiae TaxID=1341132 RepID=A0A3F3PHQ1_9EURO|nr:hypothetical protein BDQ94DRAFT_155518 [Aspergillus welwitschiae]RDH26480.1 hypothetical protein BDQ94DRAFT_155518 [Aspergillus welwitschiae]
MLIPSVLLCDWITWNSDEIAPRRTMSNGINASFMASAGYSAPSPSSPSPLPSPFTFPRHLAYRFYGRWVLHLRSSGLPRPVISRMWKERHYEYSCLLLRCYLLKLSNI